MSMRPSRRISTLSNFSGLPMDSFEQVVAEILWREGYWVRASVKVELTKEEKREIDLPSSPRWKWLLVQTIDVIYGFGEIKQLATYYV